MNMAIIVLKCQLLDKKEVGQTKKFKLLLLIHKVVITLTLDFGVKKMMLVIN